MPPSSRVFDGAVTLGGGVLGLVFVAAAASSATTANLWYVLAIALIMVICRFQMRFGRVGGAYEIGVEFSVLVVLACMVPPLDALAVWTIGITLGQLTMAKRIRAKLFNIGLAMIAGSLALLVIDGVSGAATAEPRELLAAALGASVYFLIDYGVSGMSIALEERTNIVRQLAERDAVTVLAGFLGIASLGYLTALIIGALPAWAALLVAVPVVTILVAVRARVRGSEQGRRLKVLLDTSIKVQGLVDEAAVLDAVLAASIDMLRDDRLVLRSAPPGDGEVGVVVDASSGPLWIVGPDVTRTGATGADDYQGLVALGTVVKDALARMQLSAEMTHLAWHDPLTGLANRAWFLDRLEHSTRWRRADTASRPSSSAILTASSA